jgi:hypothetical protein
MPGAAAIDPRPRPTHTGTRPHPSPRSAPAGTGPHASARSRATDAAGTDPGARGDPSARGTPAGTRPHASTGRWTSDTTTKTRTGQTISPMQQQGEGAGGEQNRAKATTTDHGEHG